MKFQQADIERDLKNLDSQQSEVDALIDDISGLTDSKELLLKQFGVTKSAYDLITRTISQIGTTDTTYTNSDYDKKVPVYSIDKTAIVGELFGNESYNVLSTNSAFIEGSTEENRMSEADIQEKYKDYTSYGKVEEKTRTVQSMAFVDLPKKDKEAAMKVVNFKDGEGRIWNLVPKVETYTRYTWSVVYPDGSYFKHDDNQKLDYQDSWKVVFPDGNSVEYKPSTGNRPGCLSLGNSFFLIERYLDRPEYFMKLKSSGKMIFSTYHSEFTVYSNYYDFETLSSEDGEKLLKENVLPHLKSDEPDNDITIKVMNGNKGERTLGIYNNGKYLSEAERKAKESEAKENEFKKNYAQACKLYGKTYVDAALNGKVIVGMPEKLFLSIYTNCKLHTETAQGKLYYVYSYTTRSAGNKEWLAEVLSKEVLVKNGKVSHIVNVR